MSANALAVWDFRVNANGLSHITIIDTLKTVAKHFCFQLEQGDSGYLHYQGRLSLIKKRRHSEKHILLGLFTKWKPNYLEPTCNDCKGDLFYVMKEDTRVEGPWNDEDEEVYVPRQYRDKELYPFQQQIIDSASHFDDRNINLVYDPEGNNGKSTTSAICELLYGGIDMPPLNDYKELIALACNICRDRRIRTPKIMFFDMPRAVRKDQLYGLYSAIEQIKKGKLYDCRYHFKSWWIDSPQVWVFTNRLPDLDMVSADRWNIWTIDKTKQLKRYVHILPIDSYIDTALCTDA